MVFGLFKRKKRNPADVMREDLAVFEAFSLRDRALIVGHLTALRLSGIDKMKEVSEQEATSYGSLVFYAPLRADPDLVRGSIQSYIQISQGIEAERQRIARASPAASHEMSLMVAAHSVMVDTWVASIFHDAIPVAQSIWGLLQEAFDKVEDAVQDVMAEDERNGQVELIPLLRRALAQGPDGPEYRRIPEGFAPA